MSRARSTDTALVIAESAIDALSYVVLHPDENARYASFGGAMNPGQLALIRRAIARLPPGATLRIVTDNNPEGAGFAPLIEGLAGEASGGDRTVEAALPRDANEVLDHVPPRRRPPIDPAHQPCCLRAARRLMASARIAVQSSAARGASGPLSPSRSAVSSAS